MHTKLLNPAAVRHLNLNGSMPDIEPNQARRNKATAPAGVGLDYIPLSQVGIKIAFSLNVKEVMGAVYQETKRVANTGNFALVIFDDQTDTLAFPLILYRGRREKPCLVKRTHLRGLVNHTLNRRGPLLVADLLSLETPAQYHPLRPPQPARSWLSVPLRDPLHPQDKARGMIIVWSERPNAFTPRQVQQLAALGLPTALALRSIQLYQTGQRRALELAVVNDIAQSLTSTLQLDEVLNRMMELVEGMLKVEAGALLLVDPQTEELVFQIALGEATRNGTIQSFRLPKRQNIASYVAFVNQEPILIASVDSVKRPFLELATHLQVTPRNSLHVPLILEEQVIGVLAVINKTEGTFTQNDMELLNSIAAYAAIAIDKARLHESKLAERDRAMQVEESVRKTLARELHDGLTQQVSQMVMQLDYCRKIGRDNPKMIAELSTIIETGQQVIDQMRAHLVELRPLEVEAHGQGLAAALAGLLERRQKGVKETKLILNVVTCHPDNQVSRQETTIEKAMFNIVQEAVNNALKHAQASHIAIHLEETPNTLRVLVADNGHGFDVDQTMKNYGQRGSLGMINLRERAESIGGELLIRSNPGKGTRIILKVSKSRQERNRKRGTTGLLTLPDGLLPN